MAKINEMAEAKGVSAAQLTLAWLLAQGDDITGIPGTTKAGRLAENLAAMDVTLSADEETAIREVAKDVAGPRIPESFPGVATSLATHHRWIRRG